jgi:hypothetical protein
MMINLFIYIFASCAKGYGMSLKPNNFEEV